jgi:hypothetical protein
MSGFTQWMSRLFRRTSSTTIRVQGSSDQLLLAAGTAALPSAAFVDDPDSGWYRSGTNQVSLALGGAEVVRNQTTQMSIVSGNFGLPRPGSRTNPVVRFFGDNHSGFSNTNDDEVSLIAGNVECARIDDLASSANGSQETDLYIGRMDGASPPVRTTVRVHWKDGAGIIAGDKVLIFSS